MWEWCEKVCILWLLWRSEGRWYRQFKEELCTVCICVRWWVPWLSATTAIATLIQHTHYLSHSQGQEREHSIPLVTHWACRTWEKPVWLTLDFKHTHIHANETKNTYRGWLTLLRAQGFSDCGDKTTVSDGRVCVIKKEVLWGERARAILAVFCYSRVSFISLRHQHITRTKIVF